MKLIILISIILLTFITAQAAPAWEDPEITGIVCNQAFVRWPYPPTAQTALGGRLMLDDGKWYELIPIADDLLMAYLPVNTRFIQQGYMITEPDQWLGIVGAGQLELPMIIPENSCHQVWLPEMER